MSFRNQIKSSTTIFSSQFLKTKTTNFECCDEKNSEVMMRNLKTYLLSQKKMSSNFPCTAKSSPPPPTSPRKTVEFPPLGRTRGSTWPPKGRPLGNFLIAKFQKASSWEGARVGKFWTKTLFLGGGDDFAVRFSQKLFDQISRYDISSQMLVQGKWVGRSKCHILKKTCGETSASF